MTKIEDIILKGAGPNFSKYFPHQIDIMKNLSDPEYEDKNFLIISPTSSGKGITLAPFMYKEIQKNKKSDVLEVNI